MILEIQYIGNAGKIGYSDLLNLLSAIGIFTRYFELFIY